MASAGKEACVLCYFKGVKDTGTSYLESERVTCISYLKMEDACAFKA